MAALRRNPAVSTFIFLLAISATFPQIAKTIETRQVADFSSWSLLLNMATNMAFMLYGFKHKEWGFVALGVWFTGYWTFLFLLNRQQDNRENKKKDPIMP